ncbi:MBL fold metallo-hydrolase RNA specificity domain-containing protein [Stieleria varia]|uniref:Ribonuclease n=1 Tax=Stieleria varia TaxID=2528005 RepID=A0A5C5ZZ23_9BACT|nr:MBL fold metallo-hydrolase [Stieleria varia]TWT91563.1 Ribonuclease [Stieleria varia]
MTSIKFCGAAGTVTGSCSYVDTGAHRFVIDCGLFQGNKTTQDLNYGDFPFDATKVEFLLLTHAHIDHSGLLPKLVKAGFSGTIYATEPTNDLLEFMLRDSAFIQETNTERYNKKRERRGQEPLEPLYTMDDAEATLKLLQSHDYEQWFEPKPGVKVRFWNAGHLLGSASVELVLDDQLTGKPIRMLFSGDLGPEEKAFHPPPDAPEGYDYIVCESTYGNREREDYTLEKRREALQEELTHALERGGNVVIPSFAVERSQELLHDIGYLLANNMIPQADVYLDSPLARRVTDVFIKYAGEMEDIEVNESDLFRHKRFHLVESLDESKAINKIKKGAIIISASGMCTAGRIKHHLRNNIWRKECTILFVGYQSPGTLGQIITSGAKSVRIHGSECKVRAEIRRLGNYSAHADQSELLRWIMQRRPISGGLFLNHGEAEGRTVLRELLAENGMDADRIYMPQFDESFQLQPDGKPMSTGAPEPRLDLTQIETDWHNDYAAFILGLASSIDKIDDHKRRELIAKLNAVLTAAD